MHISPEQLKKFLVEGGFISEEKAKEILQRAQKQEKEFEDLLLAEGLVEKDDLVRLKAYILGIPFVSLVGVKIPKDVLKIIPEPIARSHNIIAFRKKGNNLEVAMLDPQDLKTIEFLQKTSNLKILPRLTDQESIKQALRQYAETLEAEFSHLIKESASQIKAEASPEVQEGLEEKEELQQLAQKLPIVQIVDTLLKHAILQRASDIHIEPTEKELIVRYRIDGILRDAMVLPKDAAPGIVARIKVLSNLKLDEHRKPQDGRFKIETEEYRYSVRVSILPVIYGEKVVMRLLPENIKALTLEQLGLWGEALERVYRALKKPIGMILVTGPTGSGKTTTLYSMIEILNHPSVNISTIEDPVEYRIPRVNQTQVVPEVGLTFASALRALLRQDPDIIMVGEIRDEETAKLAVNAALTGHLVLSTLHTNTAAGAIPRLLEMGVEPFLLSSTLNIVLAQRLVRRLCDSKEKYTPPPELIKEIGRLTDLKRLEDILREQGALKKGEGFSDLTLFRPKPSKECDDGYKGRTGIFEVLEVTESIKELIRQNEDSDVIQNQAMKEGMLTMIEDGLVKAVQGTTSVEEVLRVIIE